MTSLPPQEQHEFLLGEMLLLGLLGRLIYQYPQNEQREWFQSLIDEDTFGELPLSLEQADMQKGQELLQSWSQAGLDDETYKEMQSDYVRLFDGPGPAIAPPWESVYRHEGRQTFQAETLEVRNWYRRYGLEPEKLFREPDDHIGLEMSFLSHLAGQALQALEEEQVAKYEDLMNARTQFLSEHLLTWAFEWCDLVIENARTDLYLGTAYLIRGTLASIAQRYQVQGVAGAAK